jgi:hypothetical protein
LSEEASARLLEAQASGLSADLKRRILDEAVGNPLALIELPVAAMGLTFDARSAPPGSLPLTARLERAFAARLDELDADARAVLHAAALEDGEPAELLQAAEKVRGSSLGVRDWEPVVDAGLGVLTPDRFRFRNPLIRSAIEQAMPVEERRAANLGRELGRWQESSRLFTKAQQIGLPPFEDAYATLRLESLAGTMSSGDAIVDEFTDVAEGLLAAGEQQKALEALETVAVRAYWGNLDDETRRKASGVARKIDVPLDEPPRLCFLSNVDPIRNGREVLGQLSHMSPAGIAEGDALFEVGHAAAAVWADDVAIPFLRAAADRFRAEGRLALPSAPYSPLRRGRIFTAERSFLGSRLQLSLGGWRPRPVKRFMSQRRNWRKRSPLHNVGRTRPREP